MLPSVIGTIGSVPFGHHGPGRFASMPRRSIRTSIPGSKSVPSRNRSRWDLVRNTLWDSMVLSRSHFANKYLNLFNNGSPPLGTKATLFHAGARSCTMRSPDDVKSARAFHLLGCVPRR
jgi:hypothetical protein